MKLRIVILSFVLLLGFVLPLHAELTQETVDSMFIIASSGAMKYRDLVEPTIGDMADYKAEIVPFLIEKLNTTDARERMTLEKIFRKIGKPAVPLLNDVLVSSTDSLQLGRVALILSYLPDTSSVENLLKVVNHSYYWLRYEAVRALGKIGDERGKEAVVNALKDDNELVRTIAAVSCGRMIHDKELFEVLLPVLDDSYYGVRYTAYEALKKLDCDIKAKNIFAYIDKAASDLSRSYLSMILAEDSCLYSTDQIKSHWGVPYQYYIKALAKNDCGQAHMYPLQHPARDMNILPKEVTEEIDLTISNLPPCDEQKAATTDSR